MAFWGVEVKPAKPYSHNFDQSRGRLRISQATLGDGKSSSKSTLQCNVGDKSPVLLCSLIPNVSETCHLELEFEEDEEVIFSVLGPRTVHLTGYYTGFGRRLGGDDSDSYGEDIAASDTSGSHSYRSDDEYESDFIDDGDADMYPMNKSSVVIEEIEDEDKQSNGNQNRRCLRKKRVFSDSEEDSETGSKQLVVGNNGTSEVESEDEDGFPICFTLGRKCSKNKKINEDKKRKIDGISHDTVSVSEADRNHDQTEIASKNDEKPKKKKKAKDEKHLVVSENVKMQNNQKEDANVEKKSAIDANFSSGKVDGKVKGSLNGAKYSGNGVINTPVTSVDPDTSKKKKINKKKRIAKESIYDEKDSFEEKKQDAEEVPDKDETRVDKTSDAVVSLAADVSGRKKKKKKNKKKNIDSDIKHEVSANGKTGLADGVDDSEHRSQPLQTRSFANGLIVEEVSMGKLDGKKASPGKKVLVHYIGKLKNGTIFDSNIGQRPFKFRIGIGEVIKGWEMGINGMRVGDKRRLTIPPAFGYGVKGVGKIPPNSWLVFDVELVDVL